MLNEDNAPYCSAVAHRNYSLVSAPHIIFERNVGK